MARSNMFTFIKMDLPGAYVIDTFHAGDDRGSFTKCFEKNFYASEGIEFQLDETFFSVSAANVIRGLHFQVHKPQAKLVSVVSGKVWDVIVDLRPSSATFGKWQGVELSAENHRSIFVPRGLAHGFASLLNDSVMLYQCDGAYDKETDSGIRFDDPDLGIKWPVPKHLAIHSERDLRFHGLMDYLNAPMEL